MFSSPGLAWVLGEAGALHRLRTIKVRGEALGIIYRLVPAQLLYNFDIINLSNPLFPHLLNGYNFVIHC